MTTQHATDFTKDVAKKQLTFVRLFDATVEQVWKAWTDSSLLDQWWAPKPYQAKTKEMDFREGGHWLYEMAGPNGESQWCRVDYKTISKNERYTAQDAFCDEKGTPTGEIASMHWNVQFAKSGSGTRVTVVITFKTEADMEQILQMGIKEGFEMALGNLDDVLA